MKKVISLIGILVIVSALLCACTGNIGSDGTFYLYSGDNLNKAQFFKFDGKKWTDNNGISGTYEINGENIFLMFNINGFEDVMYSGSIKDGVLILPKHIYCKEGNSKIVSYQGYSFYVDGEVRYLLRYNGDETSITLPESYEGSDYEIYKYAFYDCTNLQSVVIPDSVTSIGEEAFYNCTNLQSVVIPDSVTSIGEEAFYNCTNLQSIVIPDSVTSIGSYAFEYCSSLQSVVIGTGITSIERRAFYVCGSLQSVVIPDSVMSIGDYAFCCTSLQSIVIPDSVTSIGYGAFGGCTNLQSIAIGAGVTSIEENAFEGCPKLIEICNNSNRAIQSGSEENGMIGLYSKNIYSDDKGSSKIKDYQGYSFYIDGEERYLLSYNGNETSITLPESYEGSNYEIYKYAFNQCSNIQSVVIPDGVTSIGDNAFSGCTSLQSIEVGDGVTCIGSYAFDYCSSLQSVVIPDSVMSIGGAAFNHCSSLQSIVIGAGVTSIGDYAFESCYKLIEVCNNSILDLQLGSYENGSVGYYAKNIYSDKSGNSKIVDYQGYSFYIDGEERYLLSYNGNETSITLPKSYEDNNYEIYKYAFSYCTSLQSIVIGDGVTSIGNYAFYDCTNLQSVVIPDSVTSIGDNVFSFCINLQSIKIPDSITSIGDHAFSDCTSLQSIEIGDGVTSIGSYAFEYCSSLQSIEIPDSVTSIGDSTFNRCSNLQSVYYHGTEEEWKQIETADFNYYLTNATIYYYSSTNPQNSDDYDPDHNYWHYGENGEKVVWGKD